MPGFSKKKYDGESTGATLTSLLTFDDDDTFWSNENVLGAIETAEEQALLRPSQQTVVVIKEQGFDGGSNSSSSMRTAGRTAWLAEYHEHTYPAGIEVCNVTSTANRPSRSAISMRAAKEASHGDDELNDSQRKAVYSPIDSPLVILAGPGSGKTLTVCYRIAHIVRNASCGPDKIVAITFTRNAAAELRDRLANMLGPDVASRLTVGTFHSFCLNLCRRHARTIGYSKSFVVLTQRQQADIISEILDERKQQQLPSLSQSSNASNANSGKNQKARRKAAKEVLRKIHKLRASCRFAGNDVSTVDNSTRTLHEIMEDYDDKLRDADAMDFDGLIYNASRILLTQAHVQEEMTNKYKYFIVDEFQDTSRAQLELLLLILRNRHTLTVVGDDDQLIYAFNGANIENFELLRAKLPQAIDVILRVNYRSTPTIVRAMSAVIAENQYRHPKNIISKDELHQKGKPTEVTPDVKSPRKEWKVGSDGYTLPDQNDLAKNVSPLAKTPIPRALLPGEERIRICESRNEACELYNIGKSILALRRDHKVQRFSEIAILFRTNAIGKIVEAYLESHQIPCRRKQRTLFKMSDLESILAFMRAIINENDSTAAWRVMRSLRLQITPQTTDELFRLRHEKRLNFLPVVRWMLKDSGCKSKIPIRDQRSLTKLLSTIDTLRRRCGELRLSEVIRRILEHLPLLNQQLFANTSIRRASTTSRGESNKDANLPTLLLTEALAFQENFKKGETVVARKRYNVVAGPRDTPQLTQQTFETATKVEHGKVLEQRSPACQKRQCVTGIERSDNTVREATGIDRLSAFLDHLSLLLEEDDALLGDLSKFTERAKSRRHSQSRKKHQDKSIPQKSGFELARDSCNVHGEQNMLHQCEDTDSFGEDSVWTGTIHQAKGLEWPVVFVVRFNDGVLPLMDKEMESTGCHLASEALSVGSALDSCLNVYTIGDGSCEQYVLPAVMDLIEEERRLAYVALSRAKRLLFLSFIMATSQGEMMEASRFIYDLPSVHTQREYWYTCGDESTKKEAKNKRIQSLVVAKSSIRLPIEPSPNGLSIEDFSKQHHTVNEPEGLNQYLQGSEDVCIVSEKQLQGQSSNSTRSLAGGMLLEHRMEIKQEKLSISIPSTARLLFQTKPQDSMLPLSTRNPSVRTIGSPIKIKSEVGLNRECDEFLVEQEPDRLRCTYSEPYAIVRLGSSTIETCAQSPPGTAKWQKSSKKRQRFLIGD